MDSCLGQESHFVIAISTIKDIDSVHIDEEQYLFFVKKLFLLVVENNIGQPNVFGRHV